MISPTNGNDKNHQFPKTLKEKIEAGVFIQFQNKSITPENIQVIVDNDFYNYASIITDDVMADDLLKGHLNENVKKAVHAGLPIEKAIYMATYTPAKRMGLHDRGEIPFWNLSFKLDFHLYHKDSKN